MNTADSPTQKSSNFAQKSMLSEITMLISSKTEQDERLAEIRKCRYNGYKFNGFFPPEKRKTYQERHMNSLNSKTVKNLLLFVNAVVLIMLDFSWVYANSPPLIVEVIYKIAAIILIPEVLHALYDIDIYKINKGELTRSFVYGFLAFAVIEAIALILIFSGFYDFLKINYTDNNYIPSLFGWRVLRMPWFTILSKLFSLIFISLFEEILSRFYFFEALVETIKNRNITAVFVSVFFAALHWVPYVRMGYIVYVFVFSMFAFYLRFALENKGMNSFYTLVITHTLVNMFSWFILDP